MALYGKLEYWEERYDHSGDTGAYDWYQTYGDLRHLLTADALKRPFKGICSPKDRSITDFQLLDTNVPFFPPRENCRVLILGSGNSPFGEDMRDDGWTGEMVNVDFSSVVIDQMIKRHENKLEREGKESKMKFVCADITHGLPFGDGSFDLIICKGTFDAILCSNGSIGHTKQLVAECNRVLAPAHGCFFLVTYGSPDNRVIFLEHGNDPTYYWEGICVETVPRRNQTTSRNDYVYISRKKGMGTEGDNVNEEGNSNEGVSRVPKSIGEENIESVGDQNIHKLAQAGDSLK